MRAFFKGLVIVPLAAILLVFAVVNRTTVAVTFDPLDWLGTGGTIAVPLFLVVFLAAAIGVIIGGVAVWFGQGRHRRAARDNARDAARTRAELERIRPAAGDGTALPPPASTLR